MNISEFIVGIRSRTIDHWLRAWPDLCGGGNEGDVIVRPSWPEYLLLLLPLIVAILVALFAFYLASFVALGVIGLLIAICAISMESEDRGFVTGSFSPGVLTRYLYHRVWEHQRLSERDRLHGMLAAQRRRFLLAKLIGAEFVVLSLTSWFLSA